MATVFIVRLFATLQLPDLPLSVPAEYLALTGAVWGGWGAVVGLGLLRGRPWSKSAFQWGLPAFLAWYWVDRLLFARSEYAARSWPFALTLSMLALGWLVLVSRRASFQQYFEERAQ